MRVKIIGLTSRLRKSEAIYAWLVGNKKKTGAGV